MKAAVPTSDASPGGRVVRIARAWDRFWFSPADPTTLGMIRLLAGFLTLYVHIAYCPDLYEFFGKDAWFSLNGANIQRKGTPWVAPPSGWLPPDPSFILPPDAEGRGNVMDYIAYLMDHPTEKQTFLAFLRARSAQQPGEEKEPDWARIPPAFLINIREVDPWRGNQRIVEFIEGLPKDRAEQAHIFEYMKEQGIDPRMVSQEGNYLFSIWFHVTDPVWMAVTQGLIVLVTLMFAVGFCTRITSVLTWMAALSYIQRSPMTLFGGDAMMNLLLLYLMIGPSGAALSVDRLIVRWLARRRAERAGLPVPPWEPPPPRVSANFALRLIQVNFCFIYLASGTSKLLGGNWWNGTAIYYTMANYEFAPLRHAYYSTLLRWLCQHRALWEIFMEGGSFFTLGLEISLPFLVWNRRLRPYYVAASMLLHTMIGLTMGLVVFSLLMATMVSSFIPGEAVRRALDRLLARWRGRLPISGPPSEEDAEPEPSLLKKEKALAGEAHVKAKD